MESSVFPPCSSTPTPSPPEFCRRIHQELDADGCARRDRAQTTGDVLGTTLEEVSKYYFDGRGKAVRSGNARPPLLPNQYWYH